MPTLQPLRAGKYHACVVRGPNWHASLTGDMGGSNIGVTMVPDYDTIKRWLHIAITGKFGGRRDAHGFYCGGWSLERSCLVYFSEKIKSICFKCVEDPSGCDLYELPSHLYPELVDSREVDEQKRELDGQACI